MRYICNHDYFNNIDSPDKAYWIGFIWCDCYVSKRIRQSYTSYEFKMSLSEINELHVLKLKNCLNSNHIIKKYKTKGFGKEFIETRLLICGKLAYILYEKFDIYPHRNNIDKIIKEIPEIYIRDFIRGIIDADGSIVARDIFYKKSNRKEFSISICTNEIVLEFINDILIRNGITKTKYKINQRHVGRDGFCRDFKITGNNIVLNILNFLYSNSNTYLESKYEKYLEIKSYMKNYNNEKNGW